MSGATARERVCVREIEWERERERTEHDRWVGPSPYVCFRRCVCRAGSKRRCIGRRVRTHARTRDWAEKRWRWRSHRAFYLRACAMTRFSSTVPRAVWATPASRRRPADGYRVFRTPSPRLYNHEILICGLFSTAAGPKTNDVPFVHGSCAPCKIAFSKSKRRFFFFFLFPYPQSSLLLLLSSFFRIYVQLYVFCVVRSYITYVSRKRFTEFTKRSRAYTISFIVCKFGNRTFAKKNKSNNRMDINTIVGSNIRIIYIHSNTWLLWKIKSDERRYCNDEFGKKWSVIISGFLKY